jgi:hypothetical protein
MSWGIRIERVGDRTNMPCIGVLHHYVEGLKDILGLSGVSDQVAGAQYSYERVNLHRSR